MLSDLTFPLVFYFCSSWHFLCVVFFLPTSVLFVLAQVGQTNSLVGPLKWMSPEAILQHEYSEKSDSYSFGIVLWEILFQDDPYSALFDLQAAIRVAQDETFRPTIPAHCPPPLRKLMKECWAALPSQRPTFHMILEKLEEIEKFARAVKREWMTYRFELERLRNKRYQLKLKRLKEQGFVLPPSSYHHPPGTHKAQMPLSQHQHPSRGAHSVLSPPLQQPQQHLHRQGYPSMSLSSSSSASTSSNRLSERKEGGLSLDDEVDGFDDLHLEEEISQTHSYSSYMTSSSAHHHYSQPLSETLLMQEFDQILWNPLTWEKYPALPTFPLKTKDESPSQPQPQSRLH